MIKVYHVKNPTFFPRPLALDEVVLVAEVKSDDLEDAYRLTNNIDSAWKRGIDVTYLGPPDGCRSTSMGDILEHDGKFFVVDTFGFKPFTFNEENGK